MGLELPWGHKQLHVIHEGEREDWGSKRSLKKNKVCKVTKGEHIASKLEMGHGGWWGDWRCACGKKMNHVYFCQTCKKETPWSWRRDCPSCRELDKKTEV